LPFNRCSTSLISKADETKRERILSFDEERRLLTACGERTITYTRKGKEITAKLKTGREHLKAIIIAALDTAMRRGELFKLQWEDVNLTNGLIYVKAMNTKTQTRRIVGITPRLLGCVDITI
jgi:integrase